MSISALIIAKNEELFIKGCIKRIIPFVQEIIFVDNSSTDNTKKIVEELNNPKIKMFSYPETENMGELRKFSLDQATGEWIWQIDADEWYPEEACRIIVEATRNAVEAISFRVGYEQISWRG
jgi:glycosyltransferase involved in cell wall biosynthesis